MEQAISYRDRDGFVVVDGKSVKRYVSFTYAETYDHLVRSGLYDRLVADGLLIPHKEIAPGLTDNTYYRVLEPQWIPFISLPYEWTANQWKETLLTFLKISRISIEYGMILKDATPFNFCFFEGHCIFFDTLSFEMYHEGAPWMAYRQFCETLLGPFALICFNDVQWANMFQSDINGWPLPFISKNLPFRTWFNPLLLMHIHLHAGVAVRKKGAYEGKSRGFTREKLTMLWKLMEGAILKWTYKTPRSNWDAYYDTGILSEKYLADKTTIVTNWIAEIKPEQVIDLGANNGERVIAIESDHKCVEQVRKKISQGHYQNIETVLADITLPTPATGWENQERLSLLQRLECDLLMALAVIHHICIGSNVPLSFTARLFAKITTRYLLIEFVPRNDPRVISMLANRKDIFADYTEEVFLTVYQQYFKLLDVKIFDTSHRKLYLWEKK